MRSVIIGHVDIGREGRGGGGEGRGAIKRLKLPYGENEAIHLAVLRARSELVRINIRPAVKVIWAAPHAKHLAAGNNRGAAGGVGIALLNITG